MTTVCIRDVQTRKQIDLTGDVPALRVPWELSSADGPCRLDGEIVHYHDPTGDHIARTKPARLGDCKPGEIVLVQHAESTRQDASVWWLCEVCAVNGQDVAKA